MHCRVSIFHVYAAVSTFFLYGRASFFPVRPCQGFSLYDRETFFHVRPCMLFPWVHIHGLFYCTAVYPFFIYGRVTGVYTNSRPVFIIISISYYKNAIEKHYKK